MTIGRLKEYSEFISIIIEYCFEAVCGITKSTGGISIFLQSRKRNKSKYTCLSVKVRLYFIPF